MRGTLNAHKVFKGTETRPGYFKALNLDDNRRAAPSPWARSYTANSYGMACHDAGALQTSQALVERRYIALASQLPPLRPRFRMQGSGVYHTLNDPAHKPPQEVDYDDGVFLPTSFIDANNTIQPLLAAKGYFNVIETTLAPFCKKNGWSLDTTKLSCVRIHIDSEAHIDLALYVIPNEEFTNFVEASVGATLAKGTSSLDTGLVLAEQVYKSLSQDRMMLAHRANGWIKSDPRQIEDWFVGAVNEHGKVVRRVCRYLKGWRDYQWMTGGPSSIALMTCVVTVFDELNGTLPNNRDDLALQVVTDRLEELLSKQIPNPVLPDQNLDEGWSPQERSDYKARAASLKDTIDGVLNNTFHKQLALSQLQNGFGNRIPDDDQLIDIDSKERKVLAYEPAKVSAPYVPRTTSG